MIALKSLSINAYTALDKHVWSGPIAPLIPVLLPVFINALKTWRVFPVCSLDVVMPAPHPLHLQPIVPELHVLREQGYEISTLRL